ncbi:MAG: hypothetical protein JNJ73_20525 [Hyphomonadaceae bacterium]|nr:hypothetical protein [Hyphomonadaceae bacterium]
MSNALAPEERSRRVRIRIKLVTAILLAYGYALLGGALWEPLSSGSGFQPHHILLALVGLAMHGAAIYISPKGEPT